MKKKNSKETPPIKPALNHAFNVVSRELLERRIVSRKTQAALARKLGITQSQVSKIESGWDCDLTLGQIHDWARATGTGPVTLTFDVKTGFWEVGK